MINYITSKSVCELLAQQLVAEEAELVKKEAVVKTLKESIMSKKNMLIRHFVERKFFRIDGKRVIVLACNSRPESYGMSIRITFGEEPDFDGEYLKDLTKKEAELMEEYKKQFCACLRGLNDEKGQQAIMICHHLSFLKHKLSLIDTWMWEITYDDAVKPGFFNETGLKMRAFSGPSTRELRLEDLTIGY